MATVTAQAVHENKGPQIVAAAVCGIVIQVIVVALRFWSRALSTGTHFWWDDWTVLAALPCSILLCALFLYCVHIGLGSHLSDVLASGTSARQINLMLFTTHIPYFTAITLVKLSALLFYARVFRDSRVFRRCIWITGTLVVGWWIAAVLTAIFNCSPPRKQWDTEIQGHCLNVIVVFQGITALNVVIDVIILVLPLPMLWKLNTTLYRKLMLAVAFTVGYSVVIVSIARLVTTLQISHSQHRDFTWDDTIPVVLIIVEPPLATVSVCMPSILHLLKRAFYYSLPGAFSTENPSKPIGGRHGKHIGRLANPVDSQVGYVGRLVDLGVRNSAVEPRFENSQVETV